MQQQEKQFQDELTKVKERLTRVEGERDRAREELAMMKKMADEANIRPAETMSNGKVADVFSKLNSVIESLSKSNQELNIKENTIASMNVELEKAKGLEAKLVEKEQSLQKLNEELSNVKSSAANTMELLSISKRRIQQLEESENQLNESLAAQTKQVELPKVMLEESRHELTSLCNKVEKLDRGLSDSNSNESDKLPLPEASEDLRMELQLVRTSLIRAEEFEKESELKTKRLLEQIQKLQNELRQATEAEENSKRAMDDLALALTEVAAEAHQAKGKLVESQEELEEFKKKVEEQQERIKTSEEEYKTHLDEARKEAERYRNTTERLRLEAEESFLAWSGKETGFVECIKQVEDDKTATLEENKRLIEELKVAEAMCESGKKENQKLRDILKQALNESNVAKEAAEIARAENSQLKDQLADKDDALIFITRENENLRIKEAANLEQIKELKRMVAEASGKEFKGEDHKEADQHHHHHQQKPKAQNPPDKEQRDGGRRLSSAFSFNLKELIIPTKHKELEAVDHDQKNHEKHNHNEDDEADSHDSDPLKGSIFDVAESPLAAARNKRMKSSTSMVDLGESVNPEDYEHLDGAHVDDFDNDRNARKKKALLRRFGNIITGRKSLCKKDITIGAEVPKKDTTVTNGENSNINNNNNNNNKKEVPAVPVNEANKKEGGEGNKKEKEVAVAAGAEINRKEQIIVE